MSACSRYAEQFRSASGYRRRRARDSTGCRSGALRRHDVRKIVRTCRVCCHVRAYMFTNALLAVPKTPISSAFPCARVDSNHHGENSPQGPQPCASTNSATSAELASIAPCRCLLTVPVIGGPCIRPRAALVYEHMFVPRHSEPEQGAQKTWI